MDGKSQDTFSLNRIREICDALESEMYTLGYEHDSVSRYSLLTEEALLKWREELPGDIEIGF